MGSPIVALQGPRSPARAGRHPTGKQESGGQSVSFVVNLEARDSGQQGPPLGGVEGGGGGGPPELQPAPGEVVDAGTPRQLAEAGKSGAVAGGGVDHDLLSPVEQVPVRDRRIGLGQPENDGQVAEQQRSEQRRRVLQPGVVGGQDHPVVADAHPARRVGQPALEHQFGVEPIGVVPAQGERP